MEKINANVIALSIGITATVLYALCLALVAIMPIPIIVGFVNALQHSIDVSGMVAKSISFTGIITGIFGWFAIAAVSGYIFASIYNLLSEKIG